MRHGDVATSFARRTLRASISTARDQKSWKFATSVSRCRPIDELASFEIEMAARLESLFRIRRKSGHAIQRRNFQALKIKASA
jgi:hypothetical protein